MLPRSHQCALGAPATIRRSNFHAGSAIRVWYMYEYEGDVESGAINPCYLLRLQAIIQGPVGGIAATGGRYLH